MGRIMKNSGIPWIGQIPYNWAVDKIKFHLQTHEYKGYPDATVLSLYRELGIVPKDSRDDNHNVTSEDTSKYKHVEVGNFVVNKMKAWQGSVAVSNYEGIVSPAYYVYRFSSNAFDKNYFHYLLRDKSYTPEFRRLSGGIREGQWDLSREGFRNISVIIPPIKEQRAIVEYLNKKTSEIDTAIQETQDLIEKYKAYKQSIITETVTKGLDPKVLMKDSNVDWINIIPEHWKTKKLKYIFNKGKGLSITKEDLRENGQRVISYGQVHSKANTGASINDELIRFVDDFYLITSPNAIVPKGGFIFADTSEDLEGCGNAVYNDSEEPLFAGYHTIILFPVEFTENKYFAYLFLSDLWRKQIRTRVSGVKVLSISQNIINQCSVIVPPIKEQKSISDYLDNKCSQINSIIAQKENLISQLQEYKKSIIFEYVTGKKEVQNG